MCTAVSYAPNSHYFGRNLDLEYAYDETVTIMPRRYPVLFREEGRMDSHYAMIGMAYVKDGYPLYYEATNEKGLSIAGLSFAGNAVYHSKEKQKANVAPFELIPWLLGQCASLDEARSLLSRCNLVSIPFSNELPLSPLHWLIADRHGSVVLENMKDGMRVSENSVGVLTNNPPFDYHLLHLADYMALTNAAPVNSFAPEIPLNPYSLGMGSMGLPGDYSSSSRFVRTAFVKMHSQSAETEWENVSQFFHILASAEQPIGCTLVRKNQYEYTRYACCCNTETGVYYYHTYHHPQLCAVDLHAVDLDGDELLTYPVIHEPTVLYQNRSN